MKFKFIVCILSVIGAGCLAVATTDPVSSGEIGGGLVQISDDFESGGSGGGPEACPSDHSNSLEFEVDVPASCIYRFWLDPSDPPPDEIFNSEKNQRNE